MLKKNINENVARNGSGIHSAENKVEGMPRAKKDKKKRNKHKREEGNVYTNGKEVDNERQVLEENEAGEGMPRAKDGKKGKEKRKKNDTKEVSAQIDGEEVVDEREALEENFMEKVAKNGVSIGSTENEEGEEMPRAKYGKKDEKKGKKREEDEVISGGIDEKEDRNEKETLKENIQENVESSRKKKKQKTNLENGEIKDHIAAAAVANYSNEVEEEKKKNTKKKVEPEKTSSKEASKKVELVRGKRFSHEEDENVKKAVSNYIEKHELGDQGVEKVLNCKKYPEVRNCWKEIGEALPWRPHESVYHRAHILFEKDEHGKWTEEEYEIVRKFHEKYGPDWRRLGDLLGRHRLHVKDAWRRINVANKKKGQWSQDEYQSLFDLVNKDLRMKSSNEKKKSKHGMLRDNINWTAISRKLGTRSSHICCTKWYDDLVSPMVAKGEWLQEDDYQLLNALYDRDMEEDEDVDWEGLLEHRPADVCQKRWNEMVKHLGDLQNGSFTDQLRVLMNRYCPDVVEARETL